MGLDINGTRFIFYAKKAGANYSKTAMIGRQTLHLKPAELQKNLTEFHRVFIKGPCSNKRRKTKTN